MKVGFYAHACDSLAVQLTQLERESRAGVDAIPDSMTFREWVDQLAKDGLKVDGKPFTLENRQALEFIYDTIPSTIEDAYNKMIVIMKGAQLGLTVWEMLADMYMAMKFEPCSIGMYVPDRTLAAYKSSHRFMPVVRTVPPAYDRLLAQDAEKSQAVKVQKNEGNVLTRVLRDSRLLFLWTSGKVATESYPLDVVSFDEVQEMLISDMEKVRERLSASLIRLTLMLSTARWPDADIHFWYQQGTQHRFHSTCQCDDGVILDEVFPQCIVFNEGQVAGAATGAYVYQCPTCKAHVADPQVGAWVPEHPEANILSIHLPQTLSPTVSPQEMIEAYRNAEDLQNFYNRKLGKPWADPSQIPITLAMLNACAAAGAELGLQWKTRAKDTYMGIDQMGHFNVAIIKERLPDGRQAVIHVEAIFDPDPFVRCSELMALYGVAVCVVETLPNYNDAHKFSSRHRGRVFLASYADISDSMMRWGDAVVTKADRKTTESERDRYTVSLDQYKCMQTAMARLSNTQCLFPDPQELQQDFQDKGITKRVAILKDVVFFHFTKTALVVVQDPEQKKFRRKVVKVGIDPHFSYANMLCDVAWARAHGTSMFIIPDSAPVPPEQQSVAEAMPGLPSPVLNMIQSLPAGEVCGRCEAFDAKRSRCKERGMKVQANDPGCPLFVPMAE